MKNVHKVEIKLEGEEWSKCLDNAFKKQIKEVKIDGMNYSETYGTETTQTYNVWELNQVN